jgi:hypothetical protein
METTRTIEKKMEKSYLIAKAIENIDYFDERIEKEQNTAPLFA